MWQDCFVISFSCKLNRSDEREPHDGDSLSCYLYLVWSLATQYAPAVPHAPRDAYGETYRQRKLAPLGTAPLP